VWYVYEHIQYSSIVSAQGRYLVVYMRDPLFSQCIASITLNHYNVAHINTIMWLYIPLIALLRNETRDVFRDIKVKRTTTL